MPEQRAEVGRAAADVTAPAGNLGDAGARGTGIMLAVQALRTFLLFGSMVALARLLTPVEFGLVAMVAAVIGVAEVIRDFGLSAAAMQAKTLTRDERTNLFWANLGLGLACSLIAVAITPLIVWAYQEPRLTPVVPALAVVFAINGFSTQYRASLARNLRFKALGLADVGAQALSITVAVAMALAGFGLWSLVAQQLIGALATAVILVVLSRWWPALPRRGVSIRRFLRFGGGVFGTQAIQYVTKNIDNVAVGAALGAAPLGLYSRAYQLMVMPLRQINAPLTQVALPVLSRVQGDDEAFLRYLGRAQLVACYVTTTVFAVAIGLAEPLILVLFGEAWLGVVPIFVALAVGGMFRASAQIAYWTYLARGRSGALLRQQTVTGILTVVFILVGLSWGPVGVAVGQTVGALMGWLVAVWHSGRATSLNTTPMITRSVRTMAAVGVPSGAAAYVATLLPLPAVAQVAVGGLLAVGYLGVAWLVFPSVRAELTYTASFARRMLPSRSRSQAAAAPSPAPANA